MKKITLVSKVAALMIGLFLGFNSYAQVGIGTTTPNANSLLELDASVVPGGLRLPRLALINTTAFAPLSAHVQGMFVYNTATAGDVTPGVYYNNGAAWVRTNSSTPTNDWALVGNAITATDFLGTINNFDLNVRTTNAQRMRVQANGQVTVGFGAVPANLNDQFSALGTFGISGYSGAAGTGVYGQNIGNGNGVLGINNSTGNSVFGLSTGTGIGVRAESNTTIASLGISNSQVGVQGQSTTSIGVFGFGSIYGTGGQVANATGIGVFGNATTSGIGVQGQSATGDGVLGFSNGAGDGVYGQSTNGNGVFGLTISAGDAVHAEQGGSGNAVDAVNYGTGVGVYAENFFGTSPSIQAIDGSISILAQHNFGGTAILGESLAGGDAVVGETDSTISNGIWGINQNATGTGILGGSNGLYIFNVGGGGIAGSGTKNGIFGYAGAGANSNTNRGNSAGRFDLDTDSDITTNGTNNGTRASASLAGFDNVVPGNNPNPGPLLPTQNSYYGGYFSGGNENSGTRSFAYAGMKYNTNANGTTGTNFKIIGNGTNSTIIIDKTNTPRILFSPEAPEILFEDYGTGKLINGVAQIDIDPILKDAIYVDEKYPLKVFIQLEGDCNGVYVTDKSKNGFKVKELNNGLSNVSFSWHLVANRADDIDANGEVTSTHVGLRFPVGPEPLKSPQLANRKESDNKADKDLSSKKRPETKERTMVEVGENIKPAEVVKHNNEKAQENNATKEEIENIAKKVNVSSSSSGE